MAILAARGHGTGLAVDPYKLLECECGRSACETPMHKSLGRGGTTVCSSSGWVGLLVSPQPAPPLSGLRQCACQMLASMPDATQWFHSRPPSAPVPIVCVGDWVKVGLQSERFWVRVAQKVAARTKKPECYHCIVDNTLRTVPSQLAKLGDCITLTDA